MVVGVTNETGNFFPAMSVLTTHEDHAAWEEIYGYIHSLNITPSFKMADGALAEENIFGNCQDCQKSSRLMCWSHVH